MAEALERRLMLSAGASVSPQPPLPNVESNLWAMYEQSRSPALAGAALSAGSSFQQGTGGAVGLSVYTRTADVEAVAEQLRGLGASVRGMDGRYRLIEAYAALADVPAIAGLAGVQAVMPMYKPATFAGSVQTQGDGLVNGPAVRTAAGSYPGYDGTGVKVGVLSDSAYNLSASQASGDLPAGVDNYLNVGLSDEGRALMEIVHDVAPGVQLAFHSGVESELSFATGIDRLVAAGSNIIVDDIGYPTEPFFQDGIIAQAVDRAAAAGVTYISSAGNYADSAYEASYSGVGGFHDFDPGPGVDTFQRISLPAVPVGFTRTYYAVLQWDQPFYSNGVTSDFNFALYADNGTTVLAQANTNNIATQKPIEILSWVQKNRDDTTPNLAIQLQSGATTAHLKYVILAADAVIDEYATHSSTTVGHAAAAGAIAVGAVPYEAPTTIEPFSARGSSPTIYLGPTGNVLATPQVRAKPDLVGPDDVNTSFFGTDNASDADTFPNFSGTSASAPHVAGVAALLLSANRHLTPAQLRGILTGSAGDLGAPGWDSTFGFGMVDAQAALPGALAAADTTAPTAKLITPAATHGWGVSKVAVQFSEPMDVTAAGTSANYRLVSAGVDGAFDTGDDQTIAATVAYDDLLRAATLTSPLLGRGNYRLTLDATGGLMDPAGNALNGGADQSLSFTVTGKSAIQQVQGADHVSVRPDGTAVMVYANNPPAFSLEGQFGGSWGQWQVGTYDAGGAAAGPFLSAPAYHYLDLNVRPTGTDVAVNASGGAMVFSDYWRENEYTVGVQRLDAAGRPIGTVGLAMSPAGPKISLTAPARVSMNAAGRFAVVSGGWLDFGHTQTYARLSLFDAAGTGGSEIIVSERAGASVPVVASTPGGGAIVAWQYDASTGYDGGGASIYARRYDVAGNALGGEFRVNTTTAGDQLSPEIASAADGSFVIVWKQTGSAAGGGGGVYFQRYDAAGTALGSQVRLSSQNSDAQPHLDMAADGRFAITWLYAGQVFVQRFAADGSAVGSALRATDPESGNVNTAPDVGIADSGDFVVKWIAGTTGTFARWIAWDAADEAPPFGPWVAASTPTAVGAGNASLDSVTLTFNEAIDPATFTVADVTMHTPWGATIAPTGVAAVAGSGNTQFTMTFAAQTVRGAYALTVGPNLADAFGVLMNQDGDATPGTTADSYTPSISYDQTAALVGTSPVLLSEGFEYGVNPPGYWSFTTGGASTIVSSTAAYSGAGALGFRSQSERNVSQSATIRVDLSGYAGNPSLWVDFWAKYGAGDARGAQVVFSVSGNGQTWFDALSSDPATTYTHYAVDLVAALGGAGINLAQNPIVYLRLRRDGSTGFSAPDLDVDDFRITSGLDLRGARVLSSAPATAVAGPVGFFTVTFNEDIDAATFTAADMTLAAPGGETVPLRAVGPIEDTGNHRTFRVYPAAALTLAAPYRFVIGPDVRDVAGNPMDQDNDGATLETNGDDDYNGTLTLLPIPATITLSEGFEAGTVNALGGAWEIADTNGLVNANNTEAPHSGAHALLMHDVANFGPLPDQTVILHLDLRNVSGVTLDFWMRRVGSQVAGTVAGSTDGVAFTTLVSLAVSDDNSWAHYAISLGAPNVADYRIRFAHPNGHFNSNGLLLDDVRVSDTVAPTVAGADFKYGASPHALMVTFSEDVSASLHAGDLAVQLAGGGPIVSPVSVSFDALTNTARFAFAGMLGNGNYHATLSGAGVSDAAGNTLATSYGYDFFVLAGDADRSRDVGLNDLLRLANHYGLNTNITWADGDFDGDGSVGLNDLLILANNYGTGLPAPASAVPDVPVPGFANPDSAIPGVTSIAVPDAVASSSAPAVTADPAPTIHAAPLPAAPVPAAIVSSPRLPVLRPRPVAVRKRALVRVAGSTASLPAPSANKSPAPTRVATPATSSSTIPPSTNFPAASTPLPPTLSQPVFHTRKRIVNSVLDGCPTWIKTR